MFRVLNTSDLVAWGFSSRYLVGTISSVGSDTPEPVLNSSPACESTVEHPEQSLTKTCHLCQTFLPENEVDPKDAYAWDLFMWNVITCDTNASLWNYFFYIMTNILKSKPFQCLMFEEYDYEVFCLLDIYAKIDVVVFEEFFSL